MIQKLENRQTITVSSESALVTLTQLGSLLVIEVECFGTVFHTRREDGSLVLSITGKADNGDPRLP